MTSHSNNHIKLHGLAICIETPKGQRRRPDWPVMPADYGYIKRTNGADGEGIDVFVGPHRHSEMVYVIDHWCKDGSFDEHKVMLGYTNSRKAIDAFKASYNKGCKVDKVTAMTINQFKEWIKNGDLRSPVCDQVSRYSNNVLRNAALEQGRKLSEEDAISALERGEDVFHDGITLKADEWKKWLGDAQGYTMPGQDVRSQAINAWKNFQLYQKDLKTPKLFDTNKRYDMAKKTNYGTGCVSCSPLTSRFAASFAFHIDRYAGRNQPGLFDSLVGEAAFNPNRPVPSATAPVQKVLKPSKMVTGSLFDQPVKSEPEANVQQRQAEYSDAEHAVARRFGIHPQHVKDAASMSVEDWHSRAQELPANPETQSPLRLHHILGALDEFGAADIERDVKENRQRGGIIQPPESVPNEQAKPGQQLGLFGDAPLPKAAAPKLDVGVESKGKQKNLFDTHGNSDQMLLFGDKASLGTFEDRVSSSMSQPAEPEKKPQRGGLGKFIKGEKVPLPKPWSSKPQSFASEQLEAGGDPNPENPTSDEENEIVQTLKEKNPISFEEFRKRHFKSILSSMMHQHDPDHPIRLRLEDLERKYPDHFDRVSKQAEMGVRSQLDMQSKDKAKEQPSVNPLANPGDLDHRDTNLSLLDDDRTSQFEKQFKQEIEHKGTVPFLLNIVKRIAGGDHQAAEDIVQDALTKAHQKRFSWDPSKKFQTWIGTIASNTAKNAIRDRQRKKRGGGQQIGSLDIDTSSEAGTSLSNLIEDKNVGGISVEPDAIHDVKKHMSRLRSDADAITDPRAREAELKGLDDLHLWSQGHSARDIAKRNKESEGNVGRRIEKALQKLRDRMGGKNYQLNAWIERYCDERDRDYYAMCRRVYRYTVFGEVDQYALEDSIAGSRLKSIGYNPDANVPKGNKPIFDSKWLEPDKPLAPIKNPLTETQKNKPVQQLPQQENFEQSLRESRRHVPWDIRNSRVTGSAAGDDSLSGRPMPERPEISPRHELHLSQVARNPNAGNLARHLHTIHESLRNEWINANQSFSAGRNPQNNGFGRANDVYDHVNWKNVSKHLNDLNSLHRDGMSRGVNVANIANYNGTIPEWLHPKLAGGQKFFNPELLAGQWKARPVWNESHSNTVNSASLLGERYDPHDTPEQARSTLARHQKADPQGSYDIVQHPGTQKWYVGVWETPEQKQQRLRNANFEAELRGYRSLQNELSDNQPQIPRAPWKRSAAEQLSQNWTMKAHPNQQSAVTAAQSMARQDPSGRFAVTQHPETGEWFVGKYPAPKPVQPPPVQNTSGRPANAPTVTNPPRESMRDKMQRLLTSGQQQGRERPDVAEFRQAFQKQFGGPTQPDSKSLGIKNAFADMGGAIGDNLKRQLWESHRNGLTTMAGVKDPILNAAAQHGISRTDKQAFMNFMNAYGQNPSAFASPPTQPQTSQAAAQPKTAPSKPASDLDRFNYKPTRPLDPNASQHHLQMLFPNHPAVTPEVMQEWDKIAANYDNSNPSQSIRAFDAIKNKIANTDPASAQPATPQPPSSPANARPFASDQFDDVNRELLGSSFRQFDQVSNAGADRSEQSAATPPMSGPDAQQLAQLQPIATPQASQQQQSPVIAALREQESELQQRIQRSIAQQKQFAQSHPEMAVHAEKSQKMAQKQLDQVHMQMGKMMGREQAPVNSSQSSLPDERQKPAAQSVVSNLFDQSQQLPSPAGAQNPLLRPFNQQAAESIKKALSNIPLRRRLVVNQPAPVPAFDPDAAERAWEESRARGEPDDVAESGDASFDTAAFDSVALENEKKKIDSPNRLFSAVPLTKGGYGTARFASKEDRELYDLGHLLNKRNRKKDAEELLEQIHQKRGGYKDDLQKQARLMHAHVSHVFRNSGNAHEQEISNPQLDYRADITPTQYKKLAKHIEEQVAPEEFAKQELNHHDLPEIIQRAVIERNEKKKLIDEAMHAQWNLLGLDGPFKDAETKEKEARSLKIVSVHRRHAQIDSDENLSDGEKADAKAAVEQEEQDKLSKQLKKLRQGALMAAGRRKKEMVKAFSKSGTDVIGMAERDRRFVGMEDLGLERLKKDYPHVVGFLAGNRGESDGKGDDGPAERAMQMLLANQIPDLEPIEEFFAGHVNEILKRKESDKTWDSQHKFADLAPFHAKATMTRDLYAFNPLTRMHVSFQMSLNKFLEKSA